MQRDLIKVCVDSQLYVYQMDLMVTPLLEL